MKKRLLFLLCAVILAGAAILSIKAMRNTRQGDKELNILFIGNSLTYSAGMPDMLHSIAESKGRKVLVDYSICQGGATLKSYWEAGGTAQDIIKSKKWDYVVLQEHGDTPIDDKEQFYKYVRLFDKEIKAINAKTILYITSQEGQDGISVPEKQNPLTASYEGIADEIHAMVVPAGPAWVNAYQSNSDLALYEFDNLHPTQQGAYLTACVFYSILFNQSAEGATDKVLEDKNDAEKSEFFQKIAWETVSRYRKNKQ